MDYEGMAGEYVLHALRRKKSVIFERAEGSKLWDIKGKEYLVYKFKPPLTTPQAEFDRMLEISERVVAFIQREVDAQRKAPAVEVRTAR